MADISRADALSLINRQNATEIWQGVPEFSAAMRTFRKVNMGTKQTRYPVIAALPTASFLTGEDADDTEATKPTTSMLWTDRVLEAEEIAGIVIIPENVLDDSEFNIWNEVRPRIAEAIGATLDEAVFFGTNAPASWPGGIVPDAISAGNTYVQGTGVDLAEDINQTIGLVEADGYEPRTIYAARTIRMLLRGLRDQNDQPIYSTSLRSDGVANQVYGLDLEFVANGSWLPLIATAIVGDPRYAILGIRQDITYKFLDQATVNGISLAERDLIGLRFKIRVGFQTAETLTVLGGANAYPFAVLEQGS
jgi:HK97 family phage major capsid protein